VRAQLGEQHGGADVVFDDHGRRVGGARLVAVVTTLSGEVGRRYRAATDADYAVLFRIHEALAKAERDPAFGVDAPSEPVKRVPVPFGVINVWVYGIDQWRYLFNERQLLALMTLAKIIKSRASDQVLSTLLAFGLDKVAMQNSATCRWKSSGESLVDTFGRQALPMVWDYAEANVLGGSTGDFFTAVDRIAQVIESLALKPGQTEHADAKLDILPAASTDIWFTDPPYYDAVPYTYISDFFYVWLRRTIGTSYPSLFSSTLTVKAGENVAYVEEGKPKNSAYGAYEEKMAEAFKVGRAALRDDGIGAVVFAHKTTEGWEALLSGMTRAGWTITGSWPLATEMGTRLRARDSATLATSVHLVCRPRVNHETGDWAAVLNELSTRVQAWLTKLQAEGVHGADLVFACIGPALEVYSRYSRVETADGKTVPLGGDPEAPEPDQRGFLAYVWEIVGRTALSQVLGTDDGAGAIEEDARLVALFLWTLQSTAGLNGAKQDAEDEADEDDVVTDDDDDDDARTSRKAKGYTLVYDVVRRFAQPLGIHLDDWERRIIETKKGTVRLLPVAERAKQLFGEDGAQSAADQLETPGASPQLSLFPEVQHVVKPKRGRRKVVVTAGDDVLAERPGATTLDRIHAAMLLQSSGRAEALRRLVAAEVERGPEFLRLANSLSALYPRESEEKRLLDAMLLAAPR
jgi:putative DNA methylase